MEKSIEKRLTDMESSIARLTKMQGCVFGVLLIQHEQSLLRRRDEITSLLGERLETARHYVNNAFVLLFGGLGTMGLSATIFALYYVTQDLTFNYFSIVMEVFTVGLFIAAYLQSRRASSITREFKKMTAQTREYVETGKEEMARTEEVLAQVLAEWKELVPDDLVSEPKSEA